MARLKINMPVIVEGKYDKIKLDSIIEADIFTTGGFSIFNRKDKLDFFRRISKGGVIVLCDSDGAGTLIRSYLKGAVDPDRIYQLYTPKVYGKEKRKKHSSGEGVLGVEGSDADVLRSLFLPFADGGLPQGERITKLDLYKAGLTGSEDSALRRDMLCKRLSLPDKMSVNALLSALNVCTDKESLLKITDELFLQDKKE